MVFLVNKNFSKKSKKIKMSKSRKKKECLFLPILFIAYILSKRCSKVFSRKEMVSANLASIIKNWHAFLSHEKRTRQFKKHHYIKRLHITFDDDFLPFEKHTTLVHFSNKSFSLCFFLFTNFLQLNKQQQQ